MMLLIVGFIAGSALATTGPEPSVAEAEQAHINRLVRQLGAPRFQDREDAQRLLLQTGPLVIPVLERARRESPSLEVRLRAATLVDLLRRQPPPGPSPATGKPKPVRPRAMPPKPVVPRVRVKQPQAPQPAPPPETEFSLQVIDSETQEPVPGVDIEVYLISEAGGRTQYRHLAGKDRRSDDGGQVTWDALPVRELKVRFRKDGYARRWSAQAANHWGQRNPDEAKILTTWNINDIIFDIGKAQRPAVVEMERGIRVHGRLLSPAGQPVAKGRVSATWADTSKTLSRDSRYSFYTDADGQYEGLLPVNRAGDYRLVGHDKQGNWANVLSQPFSGKPGEEVELDLRLNEGGYVQGRLNDVDGNPLAGVEVEAHHVDGLGCPYVRPRAVTDAEGRYLIGPLRPGEYDLRPDKTKGVNFKALEGYSPVRMTVTPAEAAAAQRVGDLKPMP